MKTIYLVRHAKPIKKEMLNYKDLSDLQTQNEKIPLSIEGEKIASTLSIKLFNNIDYLYSSTYERAISTAKYISDLNNIPINITSNFNERKIGDKKGIKNEFWIIQLEDENAKAPNGESQKEVRERMLKGLDDVLNSMEDTTNSVIITHATAITFLLMNWCELKGAVLITKKRHLTFNNKDVINDSFKTPEIFKLEFENNQIKDINRIIY